MCFAGYYSSLRVPNPKWKVVVPAVVTFSTRSIKTFGRLKLHVRPGNAVLLHPYRNHLTVIPANWLALIDAIWSQIAPYYVLSRIFFSANETALLKHSNQTNFKACLKKSIKLQEMRDKFCNFLQTSSLHWINKIPVQPEKILVLSDWSLQFKTDVIK